MATWRDVATIALSLPEATEQVDREGHRSWNVRKLMFAWERPLRKSDLDALGPSAPTGAILAVRVADLGIKDALLASDPDYCFTTPHFDGYAAVLVQLSRIRRPELKELVVEAWLARAPKRLVVAYMA